MPDAPKGKGEPRPSSRFPEDFLLAVLTQLEFHRFWNIAADRTFPDHSVALKGSLGQRVDIPFAVAWQSRDWGTHAIDR